MSTEWDDLIKDLQSLKRKERDEEYRDLCLDSAISLLWSVIHQGIKPEMRNIVALRELKGPDTCPPRKDAEALSRSTGKQG